MMGRLNRDQGQLFYRFNLEEAVPEDHQVRRIAEVLDLSWVHGELAPHYSLLGGPSIDPVLMIRMLIVGYVSAIRSERALCREVQVNLAYRWFVVWTLRTRFRITPCSRVRGTNGSGIMIFFVRSLSAWLPPASRLGSSAVKALRWMQA
jgi:transposase